MTQADLEISVFHRSANDYGVTLRFRHAAAGQNLSASGSFALDKDALRQRQHDPAAYGELLAAQLLAGDGMRSFLDQALAVAASQQTPLHLRLFVHPDTEMLHALHWETLRLPGSDAPLAAGEGVRFSRYLDSKDWRLVRTAERDALRALVAVASPDVSGTMLAEVRTDDELAAASSLSACNRKGSSMDAPNHLALLLAAPQPGETAMRRDQAAMAAALLACGLTSDQILTLHDPLDRPRALAFLAAASRRVATWTEGAIFLHVSGHGFFVGDTPETARAGLLFSASEDTADDGHLFWDDLLAALALPAGVELTVLPDL